MCSGKTGRSSSAHSPSQKAPVTTEPNRVNLLSALLKKFSSALSVCDKYSFQSDPRFAWVDEMENDELYRKIISLPERDIDLLTLIAFEGYSQREVAEIRGIAPAAICKKIAKLKKLLYGG